MPENRKPPTPQAVVGLSWNQAVAYLTEHRIAQNDAIIGVGWAWHRHATAEVGRFSVTCTGANAFMVDGPEDGDDD